MKSKLALILALAAFLSLAVIASAGTGSAGAALPLASVTETLLPAGRLERLLDRSSAVRARRPPPRRLPRRRPLRRPRRPRGAAVRRRDRQRRRRADRHGRPGLLLADRQHRGPGSLDLTLDPVDRNDHLTLDHHFRVDVKAKKSAAAPEKPKTRRRSTRTSAAANRSKRKSNRRSAAASPTAKPSATTAAAARAAAPSKAPTATGGGTQPLPEDGDGGAQFELGGAPNLLNPTTTIAPFGPAPIGVPNFVINSFEIPPFLLPIYQACGTEYGIPWEVLAAINKIETDFGKNLNVSSAGAVGWMQFLPSSWEMYGLDANGDGRKDPYNPVDAICAAAHYLKVAGGQKDLYGAILAYNHADWYAQEVLTYARAYGRIPSTLVGSLTGLTEGAHFPVAAKLAVLRRTRRPRGAEELDHRHADQRQRGRSHLLLADPARDQHLRQERLAGRRGQRRGRPQDGQVGQARQLHRPRRHLRQPLHLRRPRQAGPQRPHRGHHQRQGKGGAGRKPGTATAAARPAEARRRRRAEEAEGRSEGRRTARKGVGQRRDPGRLEGHRGHRPLARRQGRRRDRPAHQLLDPPGRQRRAADRPEADPRRLEAARSDGDLPRQGQEPVQREAERGGRPAALQGSAPAAGPRRRRPRHLPVRPRRHRSRARSTAASSRCSSTCGPKASRCGSPRWSVATAT